MPDQPVENPSGQPLPRALAWADTMNGYPVPDAAANSAGGPGRPAGSLDPSLVRAHRNSTAGVRLAVPVGRVAREEREARFLSPGATVAVGAGNRAREEEPDPERTCFERDRDRIVHSSAFRRLAGKTQVVVHPADHERTRLTHALEVAQVATSIARGVGANASLTEAIALGHDCGHGPGGHASEDAFDPYIPDGYDHGPWGADVVLAPLNLCLETLDGIRNHSWSRPAPRTVEGEIVSWADRIAYCAHDLEDAVSAGIVTEADLPGDVAAVCGRTRREQLRTFVHAVIGGASTSGHIGMAADEAAALAGLRAFNYERIYTRPESVSQAESVVRILRALVDHFADRPQELPFEIEGDPGSEAATRATVTWIGGMTDRYAFNTAIRVLDWPVTDLPRGISRPNAQE